MSGPRDRALAGLKRVPVIRRVVHRRRMAGTTNVPPVPPGWQVGPPDFVGVGAQKAGTSWLYDLIAAHPDVCSQAGVSKERHFFDRFGTEPVDVAGLAGEYARRFPRPPGMLVGEWTPRYMHDFWVAPLLRAAAPEAKLLLTLRDPIDRFRSASVHNSWPEREPGAAGRLVFVDDAAARCRYGAQLAHLLRHFPRSQVLVIQYERCVADPRADLDRIFRFLGLAPHALDEERLRAPVGYRRGDDDAPAGQQANRWLADYLADDLDLLARLAPELDLGLWRSLESARRADSGGPRPS